jgi:small nuclear ribonucleoprotein (snRNP)-like protein
MLDTMRLVKTTLGGMMVKRTLAVMLACLLLSFVCVVPVAAGMQTGKEEELARKVETKIAKLGIGSNARVEVKLKNGTTLKGHVSEISDDNFVVADKTGTGTKVTYAEVKQLKTNNGDKDVLLAVGVISVVLILSVLAKGK